MFAFGQQHERLGGTVIIDVIRHVDRSTATSEPESPSHISNGEVYPIERRIAFDHYLPVRSGPSTSEGRNDFIKAVAYGTLPKTPRHCC